MKVSEYKRIYVCVGENPNNTIGLGYCGELRTLGQWLDVLFPGKDAQEYFKNETLSYVLKYILMHKGKRLKKL